MEPGKLWPLAVVFVLFAIQLKFGNASRKATSFDDEDQDYTNIWAVELDTNDEEVAKRIAEKYGYDYGGRVGALERHFTFIKRAPNPKESKVKHDDDEELLNAVQNDEDDTSDEGVRRESKRMLAHPRVKWVERQRNLIRE